MTSQDVVTKVPGGSFIQRLVASVHIVLVTSRFPEYRQVAQSCGMVRADIASGVDLAASDPRSALWP